MASSMATRHLWTGDPIDAAPGALQAGGNMEDTGQPHNLVILLSILSFVVAGIVAAASAFR
jgi:hypothetical protein